MKDAIVAIEDDDFYRHHGIDFIGIARATFKNVMAGKIIEGGSTITQQTVKNLYLSNERTYDRKIKEALLTFQLERKYTKEEILEMYLNQIYFGHGAYGIEVAALTYFNKHAKELNLAESAMIAGIPKSPTRYSPYNNFDLAKKRQAVILNRMFELGLITKTEEEEAKGTKIILGTTKNIGLASKKAPYAVDEIVRYITEKYSNGSELLYKGGLSIYTTIDYNLQEKAENAFSKGVSRKSKLQGALIALDPKKGNILAMVGGRDFSTSKFNRATQAKRQPGSAFKPFLYAEAIDYNFTAASTIVCAPVTFKQGTGKPYSPKDYGNIGYHDRAFTLKEALVKSDNVVAVKLNEKIGSENLSNYAKKMGIKSTLKPYLSLALGSSEVSPLEMASAYGTFANGGYHAEPRLILKIVDNKGNILEETSPKVVRAISSETAYIVTDMLKGVVNPGGTAGKVSSIIKRPAAGKTGTTQNYTDAWFVGYTPDIVAAVYIGYDDPNISVGSTGGSIAAPIWSDFIKGGMKNTPVKDFDKPDDVVMVKVCADSGLLATPFSPNTIVAAFKKGTEPKEYCPQHQLPGFNGGLPSLYEDSPTYYEDVPSYNEESTSYNEVITPQGNENLGLNNDNNNTAPGKWWKKDKNRW